MFAIATRRDSLPCAEIEPNNVSLKLKACAVALGSDERDIVSFNVREGVALPARTALAEALLEEIHYRCKSAVVRIV